MSSTESVEDWQVPGTSRVEYVGEIRCWMSNLPGWSSRWKYLIRIIQINQFINNVNINVSIGNKENKSKGREVSHKT